MNLQAHMSGQLSGQVPNQTGTQLPVLPQQNGVPLSSQMQNIGSQSELIRARSFMQQKIYEILMRRHQPTHEIQAKKLKDIVRRLEEGLFRSASQEEYMNFDTLESRLLLPHEQNVISTQLNGKEDAVDVSSLTVNDKDGSAVNEAAVLICHIWPPSRSASP